MNVGAMGVFYGYSFWMDRILAMNMGMWVGCHVCINNANVGIMGVFYGYSFWMDRIVAMNVDIMGVFHGYSFWKDTIVAMNVGIYKGLSFMGTLLDEQNFGNECGNVSIMGVFYRYSLGWTRERV
jgi:hypothetical protein